MNCHLSEKNMLLADSNELSAGKIEQLEEHLRSCRHCREYRKDLRRTVLAAKNVLCTEEPTTVTMTRIRTAAQDRIDRKTLIFLRPALQVAACAALLTLIAGGWFMLANSTRTPTISDVGAILAVLSEDDSQYYILTDELGTDREMRAIADQLLIIEGFAGDDLDYSDHTILLQELPPTTLRSRSMPGLPPTECV
jgi:hypothetical protein